MIWSSLFSWRLLETKYRCSQLLINFSRFAYIARVDYGDYSAHWIISCHDIRSGGSNNELAYVELFGFVHLRFDVTLPVIAGFDCSRCARSEIN